MPRKPAAKPRKSTPTRHIKIQKALEKALENALAALSGPEPLNPKEQKEVIQLLLQVVAHLDQGGGGSTTEKEFTPTDTDKTLLELYVTQHLAQPV